MIKKSPVSLNENLHRMPVRSTDSSARRIGMKMRSCLREDVLEASYEALGIVAPDLQHHLRRIMRTGPSGNINPVKGEPAHATYTSDMRAIDAQAILESLHQIENEQGREAMFRDRSISFLVLRWREHVERLRTQVDGD
jgi:hypothetical protein